MSQVRKLLKGQNIPKAQQGYKFQLDGQNYNVTDEQLKEIDSQLSKLDPEYRRFLSNWTSAIRNGNSSGNRVENTVSMNMLSGIEGADVDRLKRKKGSFWESFAGTDSYYAKEAINEALNITNSVLNRPVSTNSPTNKTKRYNRAANFDYDTDSSGKSIYSTNPEDRFDAYLDWLSDDKWGDSNEWEVPLGDNEAILRSWYTGLGSRESAQAAIAAAMNEVRSKPWDEVSEASKELLAYFNIGNGSNDNNSDSSNSGVSSTAPLDANGNIDTSARTDKGEFRLWHGTGKDKDKLFTNSTIGDSKPYLLNADRLKLYGLGDEYLNSILYKGRIYKPEEVSQNVELQNIMDRVVTANNSAKSTNDVWEKVGALLNFTDYDNDYTQYNSDSYYMPYQNRELRDLLGAGNYSIADISNVYDTGGNDLFEIYDFNNLGTNAWGFRAPKYYISHVGSLLDYIPKDYTFLNRNWNPMNEYSNWISINGTDYGLVGSFWGADAHDTIPYQIFEDRQGNFWSKQGDGEMTPLDKDLVEWILEGNKPNHNQMLHGTFSGRSRVNNFDPNGPLMPPPYQKGMPISRKQGGKVELKPLPFKLQMGSRLSVAPKEAETQSVQDDTPLAHASNVWETLTPADQKEITAAAIDVAGAIAGLVPGGSIAGAISGLGSTGLFLSAAKDRKGHRDASDWGQAILATGLDLVSLVSYLGETGKIAKIAKTVTRVAVPLGKIFNAAGLVEAASVLSKNPKDWDTNDLLKLSAGIQSVINIGHSAYVRRGESALAHEISTIRSKEKLPEVKYRSEKFKGANGKPIELDSAAIERIVDKTNKTPGKTLRAELKSKGVTDEALKDVTDESLLEQFGFIVGKKGAFKWARTTAKQQPQPTREEYSKNGWLGDVFDPLAKREFARREYIDRNLADAGVRSKLGESVFSNTSRVINNPRETITISSTSHKNNPAGRAYIQSLARLGQAETRWTARPVVKSQETATVDRTPGLRLDAEAAIASGEGLPNASEMARTAAQKGLESINEFARNEQAANVSAAVSKAMGQKPSVSNRRILNLGAESVSNKELRKYIIGNATEKGLTETEAVEFISSLSERKRRSVLKDLQNSKSKKAEAILSHFVEESPVQSASRKVYSTPAMQNITDRNNIRRTARKTEKVASNLRKLKNSHDPMQTLQELNDSERNFAQQVFDNQEEFQAALNFAISRLPKGRKSKYSKDFRDYIAQLYGFLDKNNLTIFTKQGGVIKAQSGVKLEGPLYPTNQTKYELLGVKPLGDYSVQDYKFDPNWKPSSLSVDLTGPLFPSNNDSSGSTTNTFVPDAGGFNKNLSGLTRYLIPGLSLGRFALNSHFQNKYYQQAVDALNAGRVDKLPTVLNTPRQDSPALDRQLQQVHLERMAGIKPATSDLIANQALWNQREGQLWNREQDIIGQQSQFGWNAQREAMNIMNQNLANQIETANDNAMRRAAVNSAIKQQAMELTQRRGQSWENLGLEVENNLKKDLDVMTNYRKSQEASRLQKIYDNNIDSIFGAEARNKYRGLSADDAAKYTDYDDYLSKVHSDLYRKNVDRIAKWQNDMSENMQKWMYLNALNYRYPTWLTGRTSTVGYKKGGYLRGSTRYKNEPDEQIWIDNNKATHKAIAKLSDNTIKLLLRALK